MKPIRQIINSVLDTDEYKLTMMQAVVKLYPDQKVKYTFIHRGDHVFPDGFAAELRRQIKLMEKLKLTDEEYNYLLDKQSDIFCRTFVDLLRGYRFDSSEVGIIQDGDKLIITIEGYKYKTILWEVPLMALISELFFIMTDAVYDDDVTRQKKVQEKINLFKVNNMIYADFGTRRRFSYAIQDEVVKQMSSKFNNKNFVGTSNVHFAMKYGVKAIGTHAHEWFMLHAALYGYKMANKLALENWTKVYKGNLGIALSDTFTTDIFFETFDKMFSKLFDGVRHDSGDPLEFTDNVIDHYKRLDIDPMSKTIVFSDGLNPKVAVEIASFCKGRIKCSFGIGTNFTNDVGVKPLNMVIKLSHVWLNGRWINCVKLSDTSGKNTGVADEIDICKRVLNLST